MLDIVPPTHMAEAPADPGSFCLMGGGFESRRPNKRGHKNFRGGGLSPPGPARVGTPGFSLPVVILGHVKFGGEVSSILAPHSRPKPDGPQGIFQREHSRLLTTTFLQLNPWRSLVEGALSQ